MEKLDNWSVEELTAWFTAHPMAGGGKGDVPDPPPPSKEETELLKAQTELAKQQVEIGQESLQQNRMFGEFLLAQNGYQIDASGKIVPIEGSSAIEIKKLTEERYLAALKGELPVDPALERNLSESEQQLRAQLMEQIGPGYETSTPGIEALANFKKRAEEIRYQVRRGEINTGEAMTASQFGRLAGTGAQTQAGRAQAAGILGAAAQTYQGPQGAYERQRGMQFQANLAQAQLEQQNLDAIYGAVGTTAGVGIGAAAAFCCPEGTLIDTPIGPFPIEELKVGDAVYSLENGERVTVAVREINKTEVRPDHRMRGVTFNDGSVLWLSFGHPLKDGRPVEALKKGELYDGLTVVELDVATYEHSRHTYDILPNTETGIYWIEGVPVGSTLKRAATKATAERTKIG